MACRAVCISSEDGAGAHEAALLAAQSLGFRLIDEDIVARAALEAGVDEKMVADVERRKSRSEEHTSELQSHSELVCRLLLEKKNAKRSATSRSDGFGG